MHLAGRTQKNGLDVYLPGQPRRLSSASRATVSVLIDGKRIAYFGVDSTRRDAVAELLQTYSETGGINYLDVAATLPSRLAVESACADLMSLMFPGFRGEALFDSGDLPDITRSRMRNLHTRLKPEICKSFRDYPASDETKKKAEDLLNCFMSELPALRKMLWTDIDAAFEGDPAA